MSASLEGPFRLSIAASGTASPALSTLLSAGQMKIAMANGIKMTIVAPATLTGTCKIQVVTAEGGSTWKTLQVNGSDVVITAGDANIFPFGGFRDLRILSGSAEASQRDFDILIQVDLL